ncbi:hypothetical protein [Thermus scotoductus]|uniref:hypothetical protein n=1 Tax=Thermus scotoductus TaxID=37636 RepID=UPI001C12C369|nr:hypothetical protein [Thermus scotoductus]
MFSALLILTLPASLRVERENTPTSPLGDIREGTLWLWRDGPLRYALLLGLSAAVSGALVLVGTVGLVRGRLGLGELEYGWTMAAFGIGATLAALVMGAWENRPASTSNKNPPGISPGDLLWWAMVDLNHRPHAYQDGQGFHRLL